MTYSAAFSVDFNISFSMAFRDASGTTINSMLDDGRFLVLLDSRSIFWQVA